MFAFLCAYLILIALRPDPARPDAPPGQGSPMFVTAARRAMLLYVPFRDSHALTDVGQALDPNTRPEHYDINMPRGEIDWNWTLVFHLTIHCQPALFPYQVVQAFHDINQDDFDIAIDPDDDDFDPREPPRRREQEWERLAREVPTGRGNLERPHSFWAKGMSTCCTIGTQTCPDNICQPFPRRLLLSRGGTLLEMSLGRSISRRRR